MRYDVIIIGAGPGGIFSAYELIQKKPELNIAVFDTGNSLEKRHCPIDGEKVTDPALRLTEEALKKGIIIKKGKKIYHKITL